MNQKMFVDEDSRCLMCSDSRKKEWLLAIIYNEEDVRICEDCLRRGLSLIELKKREVQQDITMRFLKSLRDTGDKVI